MKDEDLFSHDEPASTASDHERGGDSDHSALSSAHPVPQDAPASAYPPRTDRRLTSHHRMRLLLLAMVVVVRLEGMVSFVLSRSPLIMHLLPSR